MNPVWHPCCADLKLHLFMYFFPITSYTDTELYEEAVRDYEQIYKMAKTRGKQLVTQNDKDKRPAIKD